LFSEGAARGAAADGPPPLPRQRRSGSCDYAVGAALTGEDTSALLAFLQSPRADGGMALALTDAAAALRELLRFLALKARP
jgi:hypothetical protein